MENNNFNIREAGVEIINNLNNLKGAVFNNLNNLKGAVFNNLKGAIFNIQHNPNRSPQLDLRSYKDACRMDPDLKSFDSKLCDLTTGAINSLVAVVKDGSPSNDHFLSLDYVTVVSNIFSKVNGELGKVIYKVIYQTEEIWKDKPLFDLVEDYIRISHKTLDFCTAIEEGLDGAQISQLSIQLAVQQFDEEQQGNCGVGGSKKYLFSNTLERLEEFKMDDYRFPKEFFRLFYSLCDDYVSMREKLKERYNKMDKKLNSMKMVSMTIFGATSALILVCEVAVAELPVLTALAAAAADDGWLNSIWEKYENEVKEKRDLMRSKTSAAVWELDYIGGDVNNLKTKIKALLQDTEFTIVEDDMKAVVMAIDDIKEKLTKFKQAILDLHAINEECRRNTRKGVIDVSDKIKNYPST